MGYKKLPYKVVWVEMPDIESTLKAIGAKPTGKRPDGSDLYTVPTLHDSSTNRVVSESLAIAEYLDEAYPDTPKLVPPELGASIHLLDRYWFDNIRIKLMRLVTQRSSEVFVPRTAEFWRHWREKMFHGEKIEELAPIGSGKRTSILRDVHENLDMLDKIWKKSAGGEFWFGGKLTYAEILVGSTFLWFRALAPEDYHEFIGNDEVNGGRWKRLCATVEQYYDATI